MNKKTYAPHGLRLFKILAKEPMLELVFSPVGQEDEEDYEFDVDSIENSSLFAQCQLDHPFFVKDKGIIKISCLYIITYSFLSVTSHFYVISLYSCIFPLIKEDNSES